VAIISRWFEKLTYAMHLISGVLLISMMFTTMIDVMSRSVFNLSNGAIDFTFIGGIEITKYALLIVVYFSLPHSLGRSQVIVDLFTDTFKTRTKALLEGFYTLGFVLLGGGMCYRYIHALEQANRTGETTQDLLMPLSYLYGLTAFASGVLCIAGLLYSIQLVMYGKEEMPR
jgi:TRAP-type C4-dicarboxylate transport system permease small subunit